MNSQIARRSLAPLAALALILAQLVAGHAEVFAGALAFGFAGHGHGHGLSLLGDAGHVDVVLHHGEHAERSGAQGPGFGGHDDDHVVHFAISDTVREGKPRVAAPTAALPAAGSIAPTETGPARLAAAADAIARTSALLRTVVLRI